MSTFVQALRNRCFPRVEEAAPLLPSSSVDARVHDAAQKTINSRPLHAGTLEGMLVNSDAIGAVDAIRNAVVVGTKEELATPDPLPIGSGVIAATVGALQIQRGLYGARDASNINDEAGIRASLTRFSRAPGDIMRGTSKIATGSIDMAGKASALSGVVTKLGIVAAAGSTVTALSLGALCVNYLAEAITVKEQLKRKLQQGDAAAFQYLKDMRTLLPEDEQKILGHLFNPPAESTFKKAYKKVARYVATKFFGDQESAQDKALKAAIQAASKGDKSSLLALVRSYPTEPLLLADDLAARVLKDLTPQEREIQDRLTALLGAAEVAQLTPTQMKLLVLEVRELYGKALDNEQKRKETVFVRTVGNDTKNLLDPLMNKGVVTAEDMQAVTQSAQKGLRNNHIILSLGLVGVTVWLALTISAQVCTGGAYILAELVMNLVLSLICLVVDGYFLYQEYKHSHALKKDKIFMFLGTLLGVAAAAIGTAFAKSAISIGVTAAAVFIWLGILLYTIYQWRNKPKEEGAAPQGPVRPITPPVDEGFGSGASRVSAAQS